MTEFVASTYTHLWSVDLDRALDDLAAAGFSRVEILAAPPHIEVAELAQSIKRLVGAARRAGVTVHSVVPSGADVNLASVEPGMRDWSVDYFVAVGRLAATVGARWLVTHPGRRHALRPAPYRLCVEWATMGMERIIEAMRDDGIGVLLENTPTGVLDTAAECAELASRFAADDMGVCYDVANGHMVEDVDVALDTAASHLRLVHVSDATRMRWAHDPIGTGEIDFGRVAAALRRNGYESEIVVETLHDGAGSGLAQDVAALRRSGMA